MTADAIAETRLGALRRKLPFGLPDRVPPFNTAAYRIFTAVWVCALLLAVVGPSMALYQRYTSPGDNSQLMVGSRAGFAVSLQDATQIRYLVGPQAREAGLRRGDDIIAVYGIPLPKQMPITERALTRYGDDPAYIAMGSVLFGTDSMPVELTVRSPEGDVRNVAVTTGEDHVSGAAREAGVSPTFLSFIDVVHVVFYPFLIWAAWILHRRNSRDAVSSVLSLAILLLIGAELPSSAWLASIGVSRSVQVVLYDLGNVFLVAGILLFPHGRLSPKVAALVALTPLLVLLQGQLYQTLLLMLLIAAVLVQISCLRSAQSIDVRQQIRWALFGFTGYALFRGVAYLADIFKWSTGNFQSQLALEVTAGLAFGLSMLVLQAGLLVALIRYRLYDAEAIISRTASFAIMTFALGAIFAGVMEGIITGLQAVYPDAELEAAMVGAIVATALIHPIHRRVEQWSERRFQKTLFELRENLPEVMRDTRDTAGIDDFLHEVLARIVSGVHSTRSAIVLEREVRHTVNVTESEVLRWLLEHQPKADEDVLDCVPEDHLFPLRLEIETSSGAFGWLLIGPRPDGSIPGSDEKEALEKIAATLGRSIKIVLTREEEKGTLMTLLDAYGDRIARIEKQLKIGS